MMKWQKPEPQFRDYLFNTQLDLTLKTIKAPQNHAATYIPRLTWTNKVKRRELNKQKINNFDKIFSNSTALDPTLINQSRSQPPTTRSSHRLQKLQMKMDKAHAFCSPDSSVGRKNSRKNLFSMSHFVISRNVMPKEPPEDLSKSGILIDNRDKLSMKDEERGGQSPKHLLKSLNMRDNINIYKGNFIKFTKKGLKKPIRQNRCQLTSESQLTPWDIAEKGPTCYR